MQTSTQKITDMEIHLVNLNWLMADIKELARFTMDRDVEGMCRNMSRDVWNLQRFVSRLNDEVKKECIR